MRILFLLHSFNSLSQRLYVELRREGHELSIEYDINDQVTREAIELFRPELVLAPYLKRAIPRDVWEKTPCLVVHPGIPGDGGPSALDWAILEEQEKWGVTVLQANEVMDGGQVWGWGGFPMRAATKSSLYRNEVTEAAVVAVKDALKNLSQGTPLSPSEKRGHWHDLVRQQDRRIHWERDSTQDVSRKIRSADSSPGLLAELQLGIQREEVYLFGAHPEGLLRGVPGHVLATRETAICIGTRDGAIWVTHLKRKNSLKLPATQVLWPESAPTVPEASASFLVNPGYPTYREIFYSEEDGIGSIHFPFRNGAMNTRLCRKLGEVFQYASSRPTRVIVLWGGEDFWSNGIDLNLIESDAQPAEESWRNIQAMDDWVEKVLRAESQLTVAALQGNAGAGGAFAALALDYVFAREGVILNPHYKNMGNLFGSEYWTYSLPRRISDPGKREALANLRLPLGAREAKELGLVDEVLAGSLEDFRRQVRERALELARPEVFKDLLGRKQARRAEDELRKPLGRYREEELRRMRLNFFGFDPSYHVARYNFVHRVPHSKTPLHLARHRNRERDRNRNQAEARPRQ